MESYTFSPQDIGDYYDRHTQSYLSTYGDTLQAFRPKDDSELNLYLIQQIGIEDGQRILDAGCGLAGPAISFAKQKRITIDAITVSETQYRLACQKIRETSLLGSIYLKKGDFHELKNHYANEMFDSILFLEALGHSHDPDTVIKDGFNLLKKGGVIYIKDFYPLQIPNHDKKQKVERVIDLVNQNYHYNTLDLNSTITSLREAGFEIDFIKKFGFLDDISARSAFERDNKIDLYEGQPEFRIAEWLEIKCRKPEFDLF